MSVETIIARKFYSGDGVTLAFPTTFQFDEDTDLIVIVRAASGAETEKTLTTHYTVSGGDGETGTVTFLVAPASGETVIIVNDPPATQTLDLIEGDTSPAEAQESAWDKLTFICQRIKDLLGRTLIQSEGEEAVDMTLPLKADRASKFFFWDADGKPSVGDEVTGAPASTFMVTLLDDLTATAALTTLGVTAYAKTLLAAASASATQTLLGMSTFFKTLLATADAASFRSLLGITSVAPTIRNITATGSSTYNKTYAFVISSGSATAAATYTDSNAVVFTVYETVASGLLVYMSGNAAPAASGTLTKTGGTGDSTLTYSLALAPLYLRVRLVGAGGGGSSTGSPGSAGGDTTFGTTLLSGSGGSGASGLAGGAGGAASIGAARGLALTGSSGGGGGSAATGFDLEPGGQGGQSPFGGAGAGDNTHPNAVANTGSGGGGKQITAAGSTVSSGSGGGSGGYVDAVIAGALLSATYAYTVGVKGAKGTSAGDGADGRICVEEFFQ